MILQTSSLTKTYAGGGGCENISLELNRGQIFGLLGPNGAGKSTFVKMVVGLLHPTSGSGQLFGLPIGTAESRRRLGYLERQVGGRPSRTRGTRGRERCAHQNHAAQHLCSQPSALSPVLSVTFEAGAA